MGLNFLLKNELAVKGNLYVGYLFQKGRLLYSFHLFQVLLNKSRTLNQWHRTESLAAGVTLPRREEKLT